MSENDMNTKGRGRWPWVLGMFITGFVGMGLGAVAAAGDGAEPATSSDTRVVTETETVEVVPAVCLDALDEGERLARGFEFILDWNGEYLSAVADFDPVRMDVLNAELAASTDSGEFNGVLPGFRDAARACESAR